MAIKDWKTIDENSLYNYYERKDGESRTHLTVSNKEDYAVIGNGKKFGYLVSGFKKGKETRKTFKTKPQAMAFAMAYMRKN